MLEQRPLVRKTLYGTGAFGFVFTAAMAGTAFMLTGGIGHDESNTRADPPAYQIASTDAWAQAAAPQTEARPALVRASLPTAEVPAPTSDATIGTIVDVSAPPPEHNTRVAEPDNQTDVTPSDDAQSDKSAKPADGVSN